ncbi:hypothetical protein A2U01_0089387, partial [Trifolium medium]|nr:hypothetical protein [Trifolium medium]
DIRMLTKDDFSGQAWKCYWQLQSEGFSLLHG